MLRDGAGDSPLSARTGGVASFECLAETKVRSTVHLVRLLA
jgi:hypothetical protein